MAAAILYIIFNLTRILNQGQPADSQQIQQVQTGTDTKTTVPFGGSSTWNEVGN